MLSKILLKFIVVLYNLTAESVMPLSSYENEMTSNKPIYLLSFVLLLFSCNVQKIQLKQISPPATLTWYNSSEGISMKFDQTSYFAFLEKRSNDATVDAVKKVIGNSINMNFDSLVLKTDFIAKSEPKISQV